MVLAFGLTERDAFLDSPTGLGNDEGCLTKLRMQVSSIPASPEFNRRMRISDSRAGNEREQSGIFTICRGVVGVAGDTTVGDDPAEAAVMIAGIRSLCVDHLYLKTSCIATTWSTI